MIEHLDRLGYDEAWIGEHHSAGWEIIASPELIIAAAAERTSTIRLGTGVTSLPYHHPFLVAQRFVQLDHMTRGRAMLGCGPGALVSDAYMLGIDPTTQRRRMDEALEAIMALLRCDGPVTRKTDWFTMNEARLHLRPYSDPHFPIAVASTLTPSGPDGRGQARGGHPLARRRRARRHGGHRRAVAHRGGGGGQARQDHGPRGLAHGHERPRRRDRRGGDGAGPHRRADGDGPYFEDALGRPPGRSEDPLTDGVRAGTTLVGSPDTVARGIQTLWDHSEGGFGGFLFRAHDWADREQTWRSYELFARYVMPRFQQSLDMPRGSYEWAVANRKTIFGPNVEALRQRLHRSGPRRAGDLRNAARRCGGRLAPGGQAAGP